MSMIEATWTLMQYTLMAAVLPIQFKYFAYVHTAATHVIMVRSVSYIVDAELFTAKWMLAISMLGHIPEALFVP